MATNPKMQPKTKTELRRWQSFIDHAGEYPYAECPICGVVCQPDGHTWQGEQEHVTRESVKCDLCGCQFYYEITQMYRFGGIDED